MEYSKEELFELIVHLNSLFNPPSVSALSIIFFLVLSDNPKNFNSIISLNIKDKNNINKRQTIIIIEIKEKSR